MARSEGTSFQEDNRHVSEPWHCDTVLCASSFVCVRTGADNLLLMRRRLHPGRAEPMGDAAVQDIQTHAGRKKLFVHTFSGNGLNMFAHLLASARRKGLVRVPQLARGLTV